MNTTSMSQLRAFGTPRGAGGIKNTGIVIGIDRRHGQLTGFAHRIEPLHRLHGLRGLANGDNRAMFMNCEIALALLRRARVRGVDPARVAGVTFDANVAQEQIVNLGLKELVFAAFEQ